MERTDVTIYNCSIITYETMFVYVIQEALPSKVELSCVNYTFTRETALNSF